MTLRPFGEGGLSHSGGYTLPLLVSHLEGLLSEEEDNIDERGSVRGPSHHRLNLVRGALRLLEAATGMEEDGA